MMMQWRLITDVSIGFPEREKGLTRGPRHNDWTTGHGRRVRGGPRALALLGLVIWPGKKRHALVKTMLASIWSQRLCGRKRLFGLSHKERCNNCSY